MSRPRLIALSLAGIAAVTAGILSKVAAVPTVAPVGAVPKDPSEDTRREAIARAYIDALVSHDASGVPFAPGATRVEARIKTGFNGRQMAKDLARGPQYRVIQGIRELRMSESDDLVATRYLLDAGIGAVRLMTVEITETFEIRDDAIHAIVAHIRPKSIL